MEDVSVEALRAEIHRLNRELDIARPQLNIRENEESHPQDAHALLLANGNQKQHDPDLETTDESLSTTISTTHTPRLTAEDELHRSNNIHSLLLLADSALPLGSFAFSSGLESFLAHTPKNLHTQPATLSRFLELSLASLTNTTLPYVIAGWERPNDLEELDNDLDASLMCVVARRASVQQGKALLAVWDRSFCQDGQINTISQNHDHVYVAKTALSEFSTMIKKRTIPTMSFFDSALQPNGHLPPIFGAVCAAMLIPLKQCLYVYLLNHAKTVISAAIRASVLGPYAAQSVLASRALQSQIESLVQGDLSASELEREFGMTRASRGTSDTGQSVPALDLWQGRHEIIYSRIFNS